MNNIFIFLHLKEIHFSDISLSPDRWEIFYFQYQKAGVKKYNLGIVYLLVYQI